MNQTIVVLLILLIIRTFLRLGVASQHVTKKETVKFYKRKLESAEDSSISDGSAILAFFAYLAIELTIIYFSVQAIFSLVK